MMSQESPSDLIDTVTAEIEAIIEEEINSQNNLVKAEESSISPAIESEIVDNEDTIGTTTVTENSVEQIQASEEQAEEIKIIENNESLSEFSKHESNEEISHNATIAENAESIANEVPEEKEEIVAEYTVQIGSPSHERTAVAEVEDNSAAVPLIETILKDAPIDENDGPRAKHLKQALRKALNNTVKSCSGEKLESCFPFNLKADQFSQINSTILTALKSVIDGVQEPFDEFLKSENLVEKLNKVDEFTRSRVPGTSEASEAAILASLTPQNLIDRKIYTTKLASLAKLEKFAQKLEMENSQMSSELNKRQNEFADRLDRLKSSQQLLDAALDQISTISMDDLEVLVDKMNHQYQPSALKFQN